MTGKRQDIEDTEKLVRNAADCGQRVGMEGDEQYFRNLIENVIEESGRTREEYDKEVEKLTPIQKPQGSR